MNDVKICALPKTMNYKKWRKTFSPVKTMFLTFIWLYLEKQFNTKEREQI